MSFKSSHKVHNALRILLHGYCRLKLKRKEKPNVMRKIIRTIVKKIADYLKEIVDEELKVLDAFYGQFA